MRRAVAAVSAALVTVLTALAGPVTAQEDDEDLDEADHLVVVAQTPWVVPGGAFALRVRVDDPPPGAQLRLSLHGRVRTRSEFARTLAGSGLRSRITDRVVAALDELTEVDGGYPLRIVTGPITGEPVDVELGTEDEGVYPVVVELLDADGALEDRLVTHLVRLPDPDADEVPLATVLVLPLHAPPSHTGLGEIEVGELTRLGVAVDALLARPGVAATLVPTPEAVAGAVAADPAAAGRFAALAEGRTVLAQPWVRIDARAWRRGGLGDELERQLDAGREAVGAALGLDPDESIAVIPSGGGADAVADAVDAGADVVLVPEDDLEPLDETEFPVTLTRPFEVPDGTAGGEGTVRALMIDRGLAAHVGSTGDSVLDAHRLLADLGVLALDAPLAERAAVVVLDDDTAADAAFLEALLGGLDQPSRSGAAPLVLTTSIERVLADVEPAEAADDDSDAPGATLVREVVDGDEPRSVSALRDDLTGARADVGSYRSVFGAADPLTRQVDELILTAGASSLDGDERAALLRTGTTRLRAELGGIDGPPRQRVTLTAREGQVQLVLTNATGRPADVTLELRGDRLEFPNHEDGRVLVRLDGETTRVDLDVRARSSGDAPLDLRLTTPDGRIELGRSRVTVRTTAVSGVGLVLMSAAALFLVVWWTRTILRERGTSRRRHPAHAR